MSNTETTIVTGRKDIGQAIIYTLQDGREATIFKGGHDKTIDLIDKTMGKTIQIPLYFSKKANPKTGTPYLNISPMFEEEKYKPGGGIQPQVLTVPVTQSQPPVPAPAGYVYNKEDDERRRKLEQHHRDCGYSLSYAKDIVVAELRCGAISPTAKIEDNVSRIENYALGIKKILKDMDGGNEIED